MISEINVDVIVCLPVYNCAAFLDEALASVWAQTYERGRVVVAAYDDGSSDASHERLLDWQRRAWPPRFAMCVGRNSARALQHGVAHARNCAVELGRAALRDSLRPVAVAFLDADDAMLPTRLERQLAALTDGWRRAAPHNDLIVGSAFLRLPRGSTPRYTAWHNGLRQPEQLHSQLFREATVAQPTWCVALACFDAVGRYDARERCEDLDFLYRHVARGGRLLRLDEPLTLYRLNPAGASRAIDWLALLSVRMRAFERLVLEPLDAAATIVIWGAGRDGRRFYRALSDHWQRRVAAFCDVDADKLGCFAPPPPYRCEIRARLNADAGRTPAYATKADYAALFGAPAPPPVPVVHIDDPRVRPPVVTCVALDRTDGNFEANIAARNWIEGKDFWYFS